MSEELINFFITPADFKQLRNKYDVIESITSLSNLCPESLIDKYYTLKELQEIVKTLESNIEYYKKMIDYISNNM